MPLRPIEFVGRGNNSLLNNLLSGANVSLSRALSDGVQLTRDLSSNQLAQERNFLGERRFYREFEEEQFRDRRNFDRTVLTQDRNFAEGVRQFDALDADRDASRALSAELGRGRLGLDREGLGLQREGLGIRREEFDRQGKLFNRQLRETDLRLDALSDSALDEETREADLEAVRERSKEIDRQMEEAIQRGDQEQVASLTRQREAVGRDFSLLTGDSRLAGATLLPAQQNNNESRQRELGAASELIQIVQQDTERYFDSKSPSEVRIEAESATSREEFIYRGEDELNGPNVREEDKLTGSELSQRRKARAKAFDLSRGVNRVTLEEASQSIATDEFGIFDDLPPKQE